MSSRSIHLASDADIRSVLRAAQAALAERGYRWEPTGPSLGFLLSARINREFRPASRAVHTTLRSAGLAI